MYQTVHDFMLLRHNSCLWVFVEGLEWHSLHVLTQETNSATGKTRVERTVSEPESKRSGVTAKHSEICGKDEVEIYVLFSDYNHLLSCKDCLDKLMECPILRTI